MRAGEVFVLRWSGREAATSMINGPRCPISGRHTSAASDIVAQNEEAGLLKNCQAQFARGKRQRLNLDATGTFGRQKV